MLASKFTPIDFPRFSGSDPDGSTAISGIQNFALTMPGGFIKALTDKRGRILGATIVGERAGELI
jgi:hypothetical protein